MLLNILAETRIETYKMELMSGHTICILDCGISKRAHDGSAFIVNRAQLKVTSFTSHITTP